MINGVHQADAESSQNRKGIFGKFLGRLFALKNRAVSGEHQNVPWGRAVRDFLWLFAQYPIRCGLE
jgi:hypothetical protein